jgi:hypothetical protein
LAVVQLEVCSGTKHLRLLVENADGERRSGTIAHNVRRLLSLELLLLLRSRRWRQEWQEGRARVATDVPTAPVATECRVNP